MSSDLISASWFALRVRTKSESLVGSLLAQKGFEIFTPTYTEERIYASRIRKVQAALFPGYVFCRFVPTDLLPIVTTPAVQKVLTNDGRPTPLADPLIETLRRVTEAGRAHPHPYVNIGQRVRIQHGALAGIEGILVALKGKDRLVIAADLLQRAVSVELDTVHVVPLESPVRFHARPQ